MLAKFVDVIHTNAGGFGAKWKMGHVGKLNSDLYMSK